jgi:hypothetical protein
MPLLHARPEAHAQQIAVGLQERFTQVRWQAKEADELFREAA